MFVLNMTKLILVLVLPLALAVVIEDYKIVTLSFDYNEIKDNLATLLSDIEFRIQRITDPKFDCNQFLMDYNVGISFFCHFSNKFS